MINITKREAISCLADGHTFWTVGGAKEICETLGVEFSDELVDRYENGYDAFIKTGGGFKSLFVLEKGYDRSPELMVLDGKADQIPFVKEKVEGVAGLSLSHFVARQLLSGKEFNAIWTFHGRGSQARAYAEAVAKKLKIKIE